MLRAFHLVVVTLLLAAAGAQAQPAPLPPSPFSILDVPFVSQSEALCGGAAAAMVMRYWGERGVSAESFAPLVDHSAAGIRTSTLVQDLNQRGWNVTVIDGTAPAVARQLADGRPLIALIEDRPRVFHYVVLVGATEQAVIYHDPAKAPLRVVPRDEFERRSRAAGRWTAILLPGAGQARRDPVPPDEPRAAAEPSSCVDRISQGVAQAQAGDVAKAEQTLAAALVCPGAAALRELAGVRLLQRRWEDVALLSTQAAAIDPADAYTWKLLGTGRFLLNEPLAALEAWNRVGEPRLDLVRVNGLERTRQRPVERMLGVRAGEVLTPAGFRRAEQALRELPAARSTRLELAPVGQGLAELRATIVERGRTPDDLWSWAAVGARAAFARTVGVTLGSLSGAGESVSAEWRYWSGRPRVAVSMRAPAPWAGTWGADVFAEKQTFDLAQPESRRRGGRLAVSRWMTPSVRVELRGGADRWSTTTTLGSFGMSAAVASGTGRVMLGLAADGWAGTPAFGSVVVNLSASSASTQGGTALPLGPVITGSGGFAAVTHRTPLDLWPSADTGQVRSTLARAHPLLDEGRLRVERIGRRLLHSSGEAQYWWSGPAFSRIGAAVFIDTVRTMSRFAPGGLRGDIDVGAGVGLASLLVPGRLRFDFAHGLLDGADALSVRYVVPGW